MSITRNWFYRIRENVKYSPLAYFIVFLFILLLLQLFYITVSRLHTPIIDYFGRLGYGLGYTKYKLEFVVTTLKYVLIIIFQLLLIMLGTGFYGLNLPSIGWRVPDSVKKILAAVAVALFYKFVREAVFAFYYKSTPCFSIIPGELWSKLHNPLSYYFLFIIPFAIPIFEELFYRGFVYKVLEEKTGWKGAVIVSACLFSIFHTEKLISINFEIFLKGLIFGLLRKWDGSIWSSVAAHSTGNLLLSWFSFRA